MSITHHPQSRRARHQCRARTAGATSRSVHGSARPYNALFRLIPAVRGCATRFPGLFGAFRFRAKTSFRRCLRDNESPPSRTPMPRLDPGHVVVTGRSSLPHLLWSSWQSGSTRFAVPFLTWRKGQFCPLQEAHSRLAQFGFRTERPRGTCVGNTSRPWYGCRRPNNERTGSDVNPLTRYHLPQLHFHQRSVCSVDPEFRGQSSGRILKCMIPGHEVGGNPGVARWQGPRI